MVRAFTVPGEPKGKGRPRFNPMNPAAHPRTPEATLVYENLIGWEYRRQCKGEKKTDDGKRRGTSNQETGYR